MIKKMGEKKHSIFSKSIHIVRKYTILKTGDWEAVGAMLLVQNDPIPPPPPNIHITRTDIYQFQEIFKTQRVIKSV